MCVIFVVLMLGFSILLLHCNVHCHVLYLYVYLYVKYENALKKIKKYKKKLLENQQIGLHVISETSWEKL